LRREASSSDDSANCGESVETTFAGLSRPQSISLSESKIVLRLRARSNPGRNPVAPTRLCRLIRCCRGASAYEDGCDAERQPDHAPRRAPAARKPCAPAQHCRRAAGSGALSLPLTSLTRSIMPPNIIYSLAAEVEDPFAKHEPRHFAPCVTSSK
jgi:hypothetical protein